MKGMSCLILKISIFFSMVLADDQLGDLAAIAVDQIDDGTRYQDGAEHRSHDAQYVYHREALDRTSAEHEQGQTGNQGSDVGVEDGIEGAVITGMDGRLWRIAVAQFFPYAFVDQHVGINRHPQGQRNRGQTRQSQRGLQHGKDGDQQQQVNTQSQHRDGTKHHVVNHHEYGNRGKAQQRGMDAAFNIFFTHAGAYGTFFDDVHRRRQRTGTQQQRDIGGFLHIRHTGDLHAATADFLADYRRRDDLGLAFFNQQYRHTLADVFMRYLLENACAAAIKIHMHHRTAALLVEPRACIGNVVAGQHHAFFHQHRNAVALNIKFISQWHLTLGRILQCGRVALFFVYHANFQGGGATEDFLGLGRILHAGQLHHYAVRTLLLDNRLGHAQLIHTVMQGLDILFKGEFLDAFLCGQTQAGNQQLFTAAVSLFQRQIRKFLADDALSLGLITGLAKAYLNRLAFACDANVGNAFFAQRCAEITDVTFCRLVQRGFHVHLQQEVHATA